VNHRLRPLGGAIAALGLLLASAGCGDDDATTDDGTTDEPTRDAVESEPGPIDGDAEGDHEGASGEVLLLSYNVAGLPEAFSSGDPEANLPEISPLLEDYDIVLTQELFDWWVPEVEGIEPDFPDYQEWLRADVTHEHRTEQHPGPEAVGIGTELDREAPFVGDGLGMLSRVPFDDVERVPWTGCFGGPDTSDGGAGDCLAMKGSWWRPTPSPTASRSTSTPSMPKQAAPTTTSGSAPRTTSSSRRSWLTDRRGGP
jgi:hypothetical protein